MATSGVTAYTYTRDQIINAALRKLMVLPAGVSADSTQLSTGAEALNLLILEYQALGMPLWARDVEAVTMVAGTSSYTISSPKPLKIFQAYRADTVNTTRINLNLVPDYDFIQLPPSATGVPISVAYQPNLSSGVLRVWPTPDSSMPTGTTVYLVHQTEFEVFTSGSETPDFPQEWYNALVFGLAVSLAPEYGISPDDQRQIEKQAEKHLERVQGMGMEDGSLTFQPFRMW